MKAPKKLYLRKRCKLPYDVVQNEWYEQPPISLYGSIEYLRKDVLMDYLHERKEQQDQLVKKCHDMVSQAVSMELEQLINKLESV